MVFDSLAYRIERWKRTADKDKRDEDYRCVEVWKMTNVR